MRPMRKADCLTTFMCRQCRKVWKPSPPKGLKVSPSLCRYSLESQLNQNLPLVLCVPEFVCFDVFHC